MTALKGEFVVKNIQKYIAVSLALLIMSACGGSDGSGGGATGGSNPTSAKLKIYLTNTLPAYTAFSGMDFTITLPENVTPRNTNGTVDTGILTPLGGFTGSTLAPLITYSAAAPPTLGTIRVILTSSIPAGINQLGDVASITMQLTNGATPTVGSFALSSVSVFDAALYNHISGMGALIASVELQ